MHIKRKNTRHQVFSSSLYFYHSLFFSDSLVLPVLQILTSAFLQECVPLVYAQTLQAHSPAWPVTQAIRCLLTELHVTVQSIQQ